MSSAARITSMPERRRQRGLSLPEDPSEEELARDWTLSDADRAEVQRCRGDDNRRRFAAQLCVLRQHGRFLDKYGDVPVRILNHLNRQLGLMPTVSLPEAEREATESGHQQRIRDYLGYRTFDEEARTLLEEHLRSRLAQGAWPEDLFDSAMDALHFWRIIPPAVASIDRIAAAIAAVGREEMFTRIASRLDPSTGPALERVLNVPPGQSRSLLFRFREYPPEATPPLFGGLSRPVSGAHVSGSGGLRSEWRPARRHRALGGIDAPVRCPGAQTVFTGNTDGDAGLLSE